ERGRQVEEEVKRIEDGCQQNIDKVEQFGVEYDGDGATRGEKSLTSFNVVTAGFKGDLGCGDVEGASKRVMGGSDLSFSDPLEVHLERAQAQQVERATELFCPDEEFLEPRLKVSNFGPGGVFVEEDPDVVKNSLIRQVVVSSFSESVETPIEGNNKSPFPYIQKAKAKNKTLHSQVGTHKCLQLAEAVAVVGGPPQSNGAEEDPSAEGSDEEIQPQLRIPVSSSSGVDLLLTEDNSQVQIPRDSSINGDILLQREASKLLEIQKTVGFSFDMEDRVVCDKMVEDELRDRAHKVETKLETVDEKLCQYLWGSQDCQWAVLPSEGNSGGILSIWRKSTSSVRFTFSGEGFVGVCLDWGVLKKTCFVVNVYAKCDSAAKRRLWEMLRMSKRGFGGGNWCILGDFNSVVCGGERRGVTQEASFTMDMREFVGFVEGMELVDLPLLGRRFTWFHPSGTAMSRIDRVMVSTDWLHCWGQSFLWVLPRDVSDHCPLLLKRNGHDWGPKPFRFNNVWLEHKDFSKMVDEVWRGLNVVGWMGVILKEKLKGLKVHLKAWHKQEFGGGDERIAVLIEDIKDLDVRGELVGLSDQEVNLRKVMFHDLWKRLRSKDMAIYQSSRSKWLSQGDANSKFFHQCVAFRGKLNSLMALKVGEIWLESPLFIRDAVANYFEAHFSSIYRRRPLINGVVFPALSEVENAALVMPFSELEILEVVKLSDGNKSPGPDGYNFAFLKNCWDTLKGEIRIMFDQFHGNASLPRSFLSYFVALIPKVSSPFGLSDFRPISLLGCLYKLVSKVLAVRLGKVMNSLISSTQSAFIKGRNLVDGVVVINEVLDVAKKTGKEVLVFKVDFEKAYDSVDWGFLEYMLMRFGFCEKWIDWMRACVFAGSMSILVNGSPTREIDIHRGLKQGNPLAILVNGSPTREIDIQRGLKQGDPLAPFLFLLVAEGLGGVMRKAVELNLFKGFMVGREGVVVSHLQYADDTLCIGEASLQNLWTLKAILRGFEMASGLKINFWKSCLLGVNVTEDFLDLGCSFLNCKRGEVPFKYLGLPVGANPRRLATWEPLLDHMRRKLNSWGNKFISFGGRIVLLNSVLNSIPIFFMSFMKMPSQVWKKLIRIQRDFLWGGVSGGRKISWVKWEVVCQKKCDGGLGVKDVRVMNLSLLAKWRWRILQNERCLWREVIAARYGVHISFSADWAGLSFPSNSSVWWKDLRELEGAAIPTNWISGALERRVGNGRSTHFWLENWIGGSVLRDKFPRLFSLSEQKQMLISDVVLDSFDRSRMVWRRGLFQWEEELLGQLEVLVRDVRVGLDEDLWFWNPEGDGIFSVKSAYDRLALVLHNFDHVSDLESLVFNKIWSSPAPSKLIAFSWQLLYDRLPSKSNLYRRGVIHSSGNQDCVWCEVKPESGIHLLLHCAKGVSAYLAFDTVVFMESKKRSNRDIVFGVDGWKCSLWGAGGVFSFLLFCAFVLR
ncbi:LINE-1 reverse transcriptase like, partial [Trifolium medium]|nr:LINE-1 reverse transcriptase like [Trifolium medium]